MAMVMVATGVRGASSAKQRSLYRHRQRGCGPSSKDVFQKEVIENAGKGYLKHQDGQNVDCEFPGTRLDARDAVLSIGAEIITCSGTGGTEMIRYV
jgi:hypothetical protein